MLNDYCKKLEVYIQFVYHQKQAIRLTATGPGRARQRRWVWILLGPDLKARAQARHNQILTKALEPDAPPTTYNIRLT